MSEYQFYEFHAIDRPLTEKEQASISKLSSRVVLSPNRAVFTYSYADFPGDPIKILKNYFDALLYITNWGTKQLAFRFPVSVVDPKAFKPYCIGNMIRTYMTRDHIVLDMSITDEEGGGWVEGEGWLPLLVSLRQDIMKRDFRALYLAWLAAISSDLPYDEDFDEDIDNEFGDWLEPPVPANLQELKGPLKKLIEFFEIDNNLIAAAREASPQTDVETNLDIEALVAQLSEQERNNFLVRLAKGEANVDVQLTRRLHELSSGKNQSGNITDQHRRTINELREAAKNKVKRRREKDKQAAEKKRIKKLNELSNNETQIWKDVFKLIEQKKTKAYDEAVKLLAELKELATYLQKQESFKERLDGILEQYSSLSGLKSRLKDARLQIAANGSNKNI